MNTGGYLMGSYSLLDKFTTFSFFFALPWWLWIIGIYFTARVKYLRWHRLLSNMLLKGCLAVPCSRLTGAMFQYFGWEESAGYYQGIATAAFIIALWQIGDIYHFIKTHYWKLESETKEK